MRFWYNDNHPKFAPDAEIMRKTLYFLVAAFFWFVVVPAGAERIETAKVPKAVLKSFYKEHPKINNIRVDREYHFNTVLYEIKFGDSDTHSHQSLFTADGKLFGHEKPISIDQLPEPVKKSIDGLFSSLTIQDAEEIHHPGTTQVEYEVDVLGDGGDWEIGLDSEGRIIRKEKN